MITFSIINTRSGLSQLLIDDKFVKYVETKDIPILVNDLNQGLMQRKIITEPLKITKETDKYIIPVEGEGEIHALKLLQCGKDKKAINLPIEVQYSVNDNLVAYSYRELKKYKRYWDSSSTELQFSLFETLSQDLIEIPYVDDPDDLESHFDLTAYHTNHGTTHAIRQAEYAKNYFNLVKKSGGLIYKQSALSASKEEYACLVLAAFLFRSGRTNEYGWDSDTTYGKRSAAIFRKIALELKFNPILVELIASNCFDYHSDLTINQDLNQHSREESKTKIELFRKLLKLSHESDLVRCFEEYEEKIKKPITTELKVLLVPSAAVDTIADDFLDYAITLCKETGSSVTGAKDKANNSIKNRALSVKSASAPKITLYRLLKLKPASVPHFVAPTSSWIASSEHTKPIENGFLIKAHDKTGNESFNVADGWTEEQIATLPIEACIEKEKDNLKTHVTVYHATTKASYAVDLFCRKLKVLADGSNHIAWIRDFKSKPKGTQYSNIADIKEKMGNDSTCDNKEGMAWHLLSCNPTLLHNSDFASEESTVDYYFKNHSVINLDFKDLLFTLMDEIGLLVGYDIERNQLFEEFQQIVFDETFGTQGVIYQYSLAHEIVDETVYISRESGRIDEQNPGALATLMQLKTENDNPPNHNTLQVRLFVPNLLQEKYADKIFVHNYVNMDSSLHEKFIDKIDSLAERAYRGFTNGVKAKPKDESSEKRSFFFSGSSPIYTPSTIDLSQYVKKQEPPTGDDKKEEDSFIFGLDDNEFFLAMDSEDDEEEKKDHPKNASKEEGFTLLSALLKTPSQIKPNVELEDKKRDQDLSISFKLD